MCCICCPRIAIILTQTIIMTGILFFLINPVRYHYTKNFLITLWDINLKVNEFWFEMNNNHTYPTNKSDIAISNNETMMGNTTEIVPNESLASLNTSLINLIEMFQENRFNVNNSNFNPYKNLIDGFQHKLDPNETFKIWCIVFMLMHLFGMLTLICNLFTGIILYQCIIISYSTLAIYNWTLVKIPWQLFEIIVFTYLMLNLLMIILKDLFQNCLTCKCCRTNNDVRVNTKFSAFPPQAVLLEQDPLLYGYPRNNFNF